MGFPRWHFLLCGLTMLSRSDAFLFIDPDVPVFSNATKVGVVTTGQVTEASGLAASKRHPGILYTLNDSGDSSRIIALNAATGKKAGTLTIRHAHNVDWEDLAVGKCHSHKVCIYVADTGDHGGRGAENIIYRIEEPNSISDMTLDVDSKLHFSWNEPDAETIMVDPEGEVYIVSKVLGGRGKFAQLPATAWGTGHRVALQSNAYLPINTKFRDPVGGDISPRGDEILIKAREHVFYWKKKPGESYTQTLTKTPVELPYKHEKQGESICWSATGSGYYTLDEGKDQPLYYYVRQ